MRFTFGSLKFSSLFGAHSCGLGLGSDAGCAGFGASASSSAGPLQIWLQTGDCGLHTMASFYGTAVGLAAKITHSWHI